MAKSLYSVPSETLSEFVFHSNWIEGYPPEQYPKTSRLYRAHLRTAQMVVRTGEWDPLKLHMSLLHGTDMLPPHQVGVYRNAQVYIGNFYPPSQGRHLLDHMERWREYVTAGPGDLVPEMWCWRVHDYYETIHPFIDGNGRTGRLILNSLRLKYSLPWLIVHRGDEQKRYYAKIRRWQTHEWRCEGNGPDECVSSRAPSSRKGSLSAVLRSGQVQREDS